MHIDHSREKLIQVVTYFALHVRKLGKTKLFKLLYFVDFMHYRETGRSVTGMDYFAWKMGPVPVVLHNELEAPRADWNGVVEFSEKNVGSGSMLTVKAKAAFDSTLFSRRELKLLEKLAGTFCNSNAEEMIEETHLENSPWHKVWEVEGGRQKQIPYEYALRAQDRDAMAAHIKERSEFLSALSNS